MPDVLPVAFVDGGVVLPLFAYDDIAAAGWIADENVAELLLLSS